MTSPFDSGPLGPIHPIEDVEAMLELVRLAEELPADRHGGDSWDVDFLTFQGALRTAVEVDPLWLCDVLAMRRPPLF